MQPAVSGSVGEQFSRHQVVSATRANELLARDIASDMQARGQQSTLLSGILAIQLFLGGKAMGCSLENLVAHSPPFEVTPRFQAALSILLEAYDYARELERPVWDFAVEIHLLRAVGLTNSDLRWLVCRGFVEHAAETTRTDEDGRGFHRTGILTFTKKTCFVLCEAGAMLARQGAISRHLNELSPAQIATTVSAPVPQWDKERQELRVGSLVVKQFKVPAPNQELILAAFQEEGWPPRMDDPLPPHPEQDAKRRLHDTVTTLNRHQKHRLIQFSGDGSGQGVRWELLSPQADTDESS